jgi:hypothetical protein
MNNQPLVSCIIPIKNRQHLIGDTIRSIIAQTYSNWEMIIIDDHSDDIDDLKRVIGEFNDERIKLVELNLNGSGVAAARNMGNMLARGDYIAKPAPISSTAKLIGGTPRKIKFGGEKPAIVNFTLDHLKRSNCIG